MADETPKPSMTGPKFVSPPPPGAAKPAPKPAAPAEPPVAPAAASVTSAAAAPSGPPMKAPPPPGGAPVKAPPPPGAAPKPAAAPAPAVPVAAAPRPAMAAAAPAVAVAKPAAAPAAKKEEPAVVAPPQGVTRREFLNYVWAASMTLILAQSAALTYFFAFPRFRAGEFGGKIRQAITDFPEQGKDPIANNVGKFWMVNTDKGLMAHYKICTHLGCIFKWDDAAKIFSCPCHGSQFNYNGIWRAGPAPRGLDAFVIEVLDATGKVLYKTKTDTPEAVDIKQYPTAAFIDVDTGVKITGVSH